MRWIVAILVLLLPMNALAQDAATLIADRISISDGGNVVTASGNVEILHQGQRLLAQQLVYTRSTDEIQINGDFTVVETDGGVLTGQSAVLSRDFRRGIIQGARFVLEGQLQVAATEMNRVDGRYNQLYKAVASSCRVCEHNPTPLWRIRARRVVHDQEERQLYFDDAWFEVAGLPVLYFPKLRFPDPTLKRATGFLIPEIRTSSNLGVGLKFPYFVTLGKHADILLTPYVSAKTRTIEARFRREFTFGSVEATGAISVDGLLGQDRLRSYLFADGRFDLPKGFDLNVDLRLVSDPSYLLTYGYSDADRLNNKVEVTRTRRNEHISASVQQLRSLRAAEIDAEDALATVLGRATYERHVSPNFIGGKAKFVFDIEGHRRNSETVSAALLADCATAGLLPTDCVARDLVRAGVLANWRGQHIFRNGMVGALEGQVAADFYWIDQDPSFATSLNHITPTVAAELRWPMARTTENGARDIIEPMVQLAWTDTIGANVPNEDSKIVDFDEGNLLALSRLPGSDRYERGWRATAGFNWTRLADNGNEYAATIGKVFRLQDHGQFTAASGLDGASSDWLLAGQVKVDRMTLTNRSLFDDQFSFSKSETQLAWASEKVSASASYIWVVNDPDEGRTDNINEFNFDASYRFTDHWTASFNGRYDGNTNQATRAGLGLQYQNECLNLNLSVSRRFTSSTNVAASTEFGLGVSLNGFGRDGREYARTCRHSG